MGNGRRVTGRKRKPKRRDKAVGSLDLKRAQMLDAKLVSLARQLERGLDEQVALIVGRYHRWERENPRAALERFEKMAMVRLGFIGPGGFDRCHEPGRLPIATFCSEDIDVPDEVPDDYRGASVLMCPAKESGACEGAWRGAGMPPCYLLLLEVHAGLGGACCDERVEEVVGDFGKWPGPEECAESFAEAERVMRQHERSNGAHGRDR